MWPRVWISLGTRTCKSTAWPLKIEPLGYPETSTNNYQHTPCNNPAEWRLRLLRGGSLKSCVRLLVLFCVQVEVLWCGRDRTEYCGAVWPVCNIQMYVSLIPRDSIPLTPRLIKVALLKRWEIKPKCFVKLINICHCVWPSHSLSQGSGISSNYVNRPVLNCKFSHRIGFALWSTSFSTVISNNGIRCFLDTGLTYLWIIMQAYWYLCS